MTITEAPPKAKRGTSNKNAAGSSEDRRRRKVWLVNEFRADKDIMRCVWEDGYVEEFEWDSEVDPGNPGIVAFERIPACRCYRCGRLLTVETVTVDRRIPGCHGGTYRRNNIRPACGPCNSKTGGAVRRK